LLQVSILTGSMFSGVDPVAVLQGQRV